MKMLIQEACQGPVRDAFKADSAALSGLTAEALRPVVLRDFQVNEVGGGIGARCGVEVVLLLVFVCVGWLLRLGGQLA